MNGQFEPGSSSLSLENSRSSKEAGRNNDKGAASFSRPDLQPLLARTGSLCSPGFSKIGDKKWSVGTPVPPQGQASLMGGNDSWIEMKKPEECLWC